MGRVAVIVVVSLLSACGGTTDYGSNHSDGPSDGAEGGGASGGAGTGSGGVTVDGGAEAGGSNEGGGTGGASSGGVAVDAGTSAGGSTTIPMKNGIPIGDCKDPTLEDQAMRGCPAVAPAPESPCSAPAGTACSYEITAESGVSSQLYFSCSAEDGTWGPGARIPCGVSCGAPEPNVTEFAGNCLARLTTKCETGSDTTFAFPTAQQWLDDAFQRKLRDCSITAYGNPLELELVDGCPTRLSSGRPLDPSALACLAAGLEEVRWDCALELSCVNYLVVLID